MLERKVAALSEAKKLNGNDGTIERPEKMGQMQILCDVSEAFVGTSMMAATAGACLSLERGELAQELERKSSCEEQKTQRVIRTAFVPSFFPIVPAPCTAKVPY